jgi:hypothetical protein
MPRDLLAEDPPIAGAPVPVDVAGSGGRDLLAGPAYEAEGAPGRVRLAVGAARPQDRLGTIRAFFPDAEPFGDDNFVYADPATGKRTLYNPPGLDLGDLPSVTREGAEALGGTLGALAVGSAGLASGGPPGGVAGIVAGEALGTAAADQLVDLALRTAGLPNPRTLGERFVETGRDAVTGATGSATGQVLAKAPQAAARAVARPGAGKTVEALDRLGIEPPTALVTRPGLTATEQTFANALPFSRAARAQERFTRAIGEAVETAVPGAPMNPGEAASAAGSALKEGADAAYKRFRQTRQRLDDMVYGSFGKGATVPINAVQRVSADLDAFVAKAPESLGPEVAAARQRLDRILADAKASGGRLPLDAFKKIRTTVGELLDAPSTTELPGEAKRRLKDLYGALNEDLHAAARSQSPDALRRLQRHDRLVRAFRGEDLGRESVAGSLDKIMRAGSDEAAFSGLINGGTNRLQNVLGRLDPDQRRIVARAVWDRMGTTPQGNANLNYLLGQWNKASPEKRRLLFGQVTDVGAIEDLMSVVGAVKEADRTRNFSNTAYSLVQAVLGGGAVAEMASQLAKGGGPIPTETLGVALVPYALSEAFHRPWLARALAKAARGEDVPLTRELVTALGRVVGQALGRDDPDEERASKGRAG